MADEARDPVVTARCPVCGSEAGPEGVVLGGCEIRRCSRCSHRFAGGAPCTPENYEQSYADGSYKEFYVNETVEHADEDFAAHPTYRPFFEEVARAERPRLLDVACGTGRFCRAAKSRGWDVTGIDVSDSALAAAARICDGTFARMSLDEAVGKMKDFDVVTAFEFLEHLADPAGAARSMMALLRPGGLLFVTVPCWHSRDFQESPLKDALPPVHVQFFTDRSLSTLLRRCGFDGVRVRGIRMRPKVRGARSLVWAIRRRLQPPPGLYAMGKRSEG